MSKFNDLVFSIILKEYDRDDPSDNFWQAAKDYKRNEIKKNTLYSKPIVPLKNEDKVYIKAILIDKNSSNIISILYLTNNNTFPYTYDKKKANKFAISVAENFIKNHKKQEINNYGKIYERHFELEKVND